MHPNGIVAEAEQRLRAHDLIPPISSIGIMPGSPNRLMNAIERLVERVRGESVLLTVRRAIEPDIADRVADAMGSLRYELRQVSPTHGTLYSRHEELGDDRDRE